MYNTLSKTNYIWMHIIMGGIILDIMKELLLSYTLVPNLKTSGIMFISIYVLCIFGGFILRFENRRTIGTVCLNVFFPVGVYVVIAYIKIRPVVIFTLLGISLVLALLLSIFILCGKIKTDDKNRRLRIIKSRIRRALSVSQTLLTLGMFVIVTIISVEILSTGKLEEPASVSSESYKGDAYVISENMDMLMLLDDDSWDNLDITQKMKVLYTVVNIEKQKLGLTTKLDITYDVLEDELMSYYSDSSKMIVMNVSTLLSESSWGTVMCVCHEVYHSYEHRLVDMYNSVGDEYKNLHIFSNVDEYEQEFNDYITPEVSYEGYVDQISEKDARTYQQSRGRDYFYWVNYYMLKNDKSG